MNITLAYQIARAALVALLITAASAKAAAQNYSDIWWNPLQPGWGLIIIDHDTDLFVVWCTYDSAGRATWYVIPGGTFQFDRAVFQGNLYMTRSPAGGHFFGPAEATLVGTARIEFESVFDEFDLGIRFLVSRIGAPPNSEMYFAMRQPFGFGYASWRDPRVTDMWWEGDSPGWGYAAIQHGADDVFGVLLTYTQDGSPTFFVAPSRRREDVIGFRRFDGALYKSQVTAVHGTHDWATLQVARVGSASTTFSADSAGRATAMELSLNNSEGASVQTFMSRLPFGLPGPTP